MNVIFGSGLIGLLAKEILGDSWTIIPFSKSRFFTFNPPLDDNFITADDAIDDIIKQMLKMSDVTIIGKPVKYDYRVSWSYNGSIIRKYDNAICEDWSYKLFSNDCPGQLTSYMKNRMDLQVYDIRCNVLYEKLLNKHMQHIKQQSEIGQVTEIGPNYFIRKGNKQHFDNAINTIPLYALLKLMNIKAEMRFKPVHYLHVQTEKLDFEGSNQLLVADNNIAFYKVTNIAKNRYLFYFHENVENFGIYLMNIIKDQFEIIDGTVISDAIPIGLTPNLSNIEQQANIFSVGSYAQWDWCMDVGSCILRLIRYSNRGNKPGKMQSVIL